MNVPENKPIRAYYFAPDDNLLPNGDGRPIAVGTTHHVPAPLELCKRGLHASKHPMDALMYALTCNLYRVECWGEVEVGEDKLCAEYRKYYAHIDATHVLRKFACLCALDVLPDDAPAVVREYLRTQNENIRKAARKAAYYVAYYTAYYATHYIACAAACDAARSAACDAARSAACYVACSAAYYAAEAKQRKRLSTMIRRAFSANN